MLTKYRESKNKEQGSFLKRLEGIEVSKMIKFSFSVTNNVAEYKALILGLEFSRKTDIRSLKAYGDSNLLVQQMNDECNVRDSTLKKYVELAKELARSFKQLHIENISRSMNTEVDSFSKAE